MLTAAEVSKHNTRESCWVVIRGQAYDLTNFLDEHPGKCGPLSILGNAGKDATEEYEAEHPAGTIEKHLDRQYHLGPVAGDLATLQITIPVPLATKPSEQYEKPPLNMIQNLDEFETIAQKVASENAWVYYSSSADTTTSFKTNRSDWSKISFRPRVLRDVAKVNTKQRIMSHEASLPIFVSPAARVKLAHPDGELCIVRGTSLYNVPYCTSNSASTSHVEMARCFQSEAKGQADQGALMFQLYVPVQKDRARSIVAEARDLGFKALVLTVDSAVIGKREESDRIKTKQNPNLDGIPPFKHQTPNSTTVPRGTHNSTVTWDDLHWIRSEWQNAGPILLKGIQTAEDALMAMEAGVDGIYLSNHGGRQLDYAPSSIRTLLEIRKFCPQVLERLEVYLDGGCRRGSDVVKALCLGATAVGLGRPFLYAVAGYGTEGVHRAIAKTTVLSDEIQTTMRLLGATSLSQLNPHYVNTKVLSNELPDEILLAPRSKL